MNDSEKDMVGVILGGGNGTRLRPLTEVTHKHLLPVYDKPMIFYPLDRMSETGVEECVLVANPEYVSSYEQLIGSEWNGMRIRYAIQNEVGGGIADAIGMAEPFVDDEGVCVMLGDNIFTENPIKNFDSPRENCAEIIVKDVEHPELNGVVEFDNDGNIVSIEEKPEVPKSSWVQTGAYLYPKDVFDKIAELTPSERDELEVTDLNNSYLADGRLNASYYGGEWIDAGTSFDHLLEASNKVKEMNATS